MYLLLTFLYLFQEETNEYIRKIVKEKLSEFMSEAEGMKQYLASINN